MKKHASHTHIAYASLAPDELAHFNSLRHRAGESPSDGQSVTVTHAAMAAIPDAPVVEQRAAFKAFFHAMNLGSSCANYAVICRLLKNSASTLAQALPQIAGEVEKNNARKALGAYLAMGRRQNIIFQDRLAMAEPQAAVWATLIRQLETTAPNQQRPILYRLEPDRYFSVKHVLC